MQETQSRNAATRGSPHAVELGYGATDVLLVTLTLVAAGGNRGGWETHIVVVPTRIATRALKKAIQEKGHIWQFTGIPFFQETQLSICLLKYTKLLNMTLIC